jgi:two-component SAPR family response regulator
VLIFTDPILALEHFQVTEHAYVLVISDFKRYGLNGMEFLKKIKDLNSSVRTI